MLTNIWGLLCAFALVTGGSELDWHSWSPSTVQKPRRRSALRFHESIVRYLGWEKNLTFLFSKHLAKFLLVVWEQRASLVQKSESRANLRVTEVLKHPNGQWQLQINPFMQRRVSKKKKKKSCGNLKATHGILEKITPGKFLNRPQFLSPVWRFPKLHDCWTERWVLVGRSDCKSSLMHAEGQMSRGGLAEDREVHL